MVFFFQYANFITGKATQDKGTWQTYPFKIVHIRKGFPFLRLVGTVHATAFDVSSPANHFLKFDNVSTTQEWLEDIRQTIAFRTTYDNEMIPSTEALYFHWKRTCWILNMWGQADKNNMHLEPIDQYGWTLEDNTLSVVWDTPENMQVLRDRLNITERNWLCR